MRGSLGLEEVGEGKMDGYGSQKLYIRSYLEIFRILRKWKDLGDMTIVFGRTESADECIVSYHFLLLIVGYWPFA